MAAEFRFGSTGDGLVHGLRTLGWDVCDIDTRNYFPPTSSLVSKVLSRMTRQASIAAFNAAILEAAEQLKPQVFLTVKGSWLCSDTLRRLAELNVLLVNYYPDFHFDYVDIDQSILPLFHLFCTTKSFQVSYLQSILGENSVALIHHGYADQVHGPRSLAVADDEYIADVTYVGNYSPAKETWLTPIVKKLPHVKLCIVGSRWEFAHDSAVRKCAVGHKLDGHFYARAVQHSRINIAVHMGFNSKGWEDLVSTRTFEIPACKGFMLHIDNLEVRTLFEVGTEIDVFASEADLVEKVGFYLARPDLRGDMIERAYSRCVPSYGYDARARVISEKIVALLGSRR